MSKETRNGIRLKQCSTHRKGCVFDEGAAREIGGRGMGIRKEGRSKLKSVEQGSAWGGGRRFST